MFKLKTCNTGYCTKITAWELFGWGFLFETGKNLNADHITIFTPFGDYGWCCNYK